MNSTFVHSDARGRSFLVVLCLAWSVYGRAAQPAAEVILFDFRIAAQPLDEALQEVSRQSGMQVIFFSDLTEGLEAPGVMGKFTAMAALRELLAGSGLSLRVITDRTVEIYRADAAPSRAERK